mmetsp:Transcript_124762/g.399753  ORF Transcript_124762/g.399753 Transcript_124762/m.399753 type:complete len:1103 (+) Transcript_124762:57-3365(+)
MQAAEAEVSRTHADGRTPDIDRAPAKRADAGDVAAAADGDGGSEPDGSDAVRADERGPELARSSSEACREDVSQVAASSDDNRRSCEQPHADLDPDPRVEEAQESSCRIPSCDFGVEDAQTSLAVPTMHPKCPQPTSDILKEDVLESCLVPNVQDQQLSSDLDVDEATESSLVQLLLPEHPHPSCDPRVDTVQKSALVIPDLIQEWSNPSSDVNMEETKESSLVQVLLPEHPLPSCDPREDNEQKSLLDVPDLLPECLNASSDGKMEKAKESSLVQVLLPEHPQPSCNPRVDNAWECSLVPDLLPECSKPSSDLKMEEAKESSLVQILPPSCPRLGSDPSAEQAQRSEPVPMMPLECPQASRKHESNHFSAPVPRPHGPNYEHDSEAAQEAELAESASIAEVPKSWYGHASFVVEAELQHAAQSRALDQGHKSLVVEEELQDVAMSQAFDQGHESLGVEAELQDAAKSQALDPGGRGAIALESSVQLPLPWPQLPPAAGGAKRGTPGLEWEAYDELPLPCELSDTSPTSMEIPTESKLRIPRGGGAPVLSTPFEQSRPGQFETAMFPLPRGAAMSRPPTILGEWDAAFLRRAGVMATVVDAGSAEIPSELLHAPVRSTQIMPSPRGLPQMDGSPALTEIPSEFMLEVPTRSAPSMASRSPPRRGLGLAPEVEHADDFAVAPGLGAIDGAGVGVGGASAVGDGGSGATVGGEEQMLVQRVGGRYFAPGRGLRRPRSSGTFGGASRGPAAGGSEPPRQHPQPEEEAVHRPEPQGPAGGRGHGVQLARPACLPPIPPQGDGACNWSHHSGSSVSGSSRGSSCSSSGRDGADGSGDGGGGSSSSRSPAPSLGGTVAAVGGSARSDAGGLSAEGAALVADGSPPHEEVASEEPLTRLPIRAMPRTAGTTMAGLQHAGAGAEDVTATLPLEARLSNTLHPRAVATGDALPPLEYSSAWQVADELGHTGGMAAPRYLLVRLGECIPAETGAAPVHLSRLDAGTQWQDFLNYGDGRDLGGSLALDELLACPCCLAIFRQPIALPCGHSLCRGCYARIASGPAPGRRCPMCRADFPQHDLRVNLALGAVCDALRAHRVVNRARSGHLFIGE